jgi:putative transcriptional regulator
MKQLNGRKDKVTSSKRVPNRRKLTELERDVVEGFDELAADLKRTPRLALQKYNLKSMAIRLRPRIFTPADVKAVRNSLQASQGLFAQFIGVSVKTVRAWENGKQPSDMACRFLEEIRHSPKFWQGRLRDCLQAK